MIADFTQVKENFPGKTYLPENFLVKAYFPENFFSAASITLLILVYTPDRE